MSGHWDYHARQDLEHAATSDRATNSGGQGHDRLLEANPTYRPSSTMTIADGASDDEVEITAGQKMLSAMSGSLLTSLLGEFCWIGVIRSYC